jgi:hypothetical protein
MKLYLDIFEFVPKCPIRSVFLVGFSGISAKLECYGIRSNYDVLQEMGSPIFF